MIHWQTVKEFFGFDNSGVEQTTSQSNLKPIRPPAAGRPPIKKASVRGSNYYRRRDKYYSAVDDSLIEDVLLLVVLAELYSDGDINEYEGETTLEEVVANEEPVEDLLDIDVSDTPVTKAENWKVDVPAEEYVAPATYEPEPVRESVSAGSSYSAGSSDYDSGSSDSGGSDD